MTNSFGDRAPQGVSTVTGAKLYEGRMNEEVCMLISMSDGLAALCTSLLVRVEAVRENVVRFGGA